MPPIHELPHPTQALETEQYLPIREVTKQTGVNPVTLRAWERRYGLVIPLRTAKGHRLYTQQHVEQIHQILTWINRGVAVSRIRELLEQNQDAVETPGDDPWEQLRQELGAAVTALAERRLDEAYNRATALYPTPTLCQHLLLPLLDELEQRWQSQFGSQLERVFFQTWLRSKLAMRVYHNNRQQQGAPVLLVNLSDNAELGMWLCAWLLSDAYSAVEVLDSAIPLEELTLAIERLQPKAVLLYSSHSVDLAALNRHIQRLQQHSAVAIMLVGPAVKIHQHELNTVTWPSEASLLDVPQRLFVSKVSPSTPPNPAQQ